MADDQKVYPIPYRSHLVESFEPGQTLIIKGASIPESKRFNINFHKGDFTDGDVPLHISVRFDEGEVVLNTFSDGKWDKEKRKKNPIKKGDTFDIRVRAHDDKFEISIDQKEFKDYEHKLPLDSITQISIDGDLYLNQVQWGGKYYPIPFDSKIAQGFGTGKRLIISGRPEEKSNRFNINLLKENGELVLHFNPRFDQNCVVRNSKTEDTWGNEEREGKLPFKKEVGFDLAIVNEKYGFQIFVDGERYCAFAHRSDPNSITRLQVQGDVELTDVQIVNA